MDPSAIQEISDFHDTALMPLASPSQVDRYKLKGTVTKIAHRQLNVRDVVSGGRFSMKSLVSWKEKPKYVCVKEIRVEWLPHVELNHVAFMDVKIFNTFAEDIRGKNKSSFFEGMFPVHVHWSISIASPRWISVAKYLCDSPWSYVITAKNIPQDALEKAGEMILSYVIEKGERSSDSNWVAPTITLDPTPFPYMIPFYKVKGPGGFFESNISNITSMIGTIRQALINVGVNKTITDDTIWAMSNLINASQQSHIASMERNKPGASLGIIENMIKLITKDPLPGYPPYGSVLTAAENTITALVSKEINGIGNEAGTCNTGELL